LRASDPVIHHRAMEERDPIGRRGFLRSGTGVLAGLAWPRMLERIAEGADNTPRDFWRRIRREFLIPEERIYLNVGTLGAQPRVVLEAAAEHMRRVAMSLPPAVDWSVVKSAVARVLDCDPDGLVFPRNTTEAMSFVANGLDLAAGDEVLTTNHEHIGGLCCWQLLAARRAVVLRQLDIPTPAPDDAAIVDIFRRAITPRTRLISFSHVNFTTGLIMPAHALVALAREHGLIAVVDGAHPPGLMRVGVRDIDPDFYATSPHKWLLAPQGTGALYIREDWRTRLWPTLASGDWDKKELGAQRFNHLGTFDESRLAALLGAVSFLDTIGFDRVHARIAQLRERMVAGLSGLARVRIVSPAAPRAAGMVSFRVDGVDSIELQKKLGEKNVRTRVIGEYDYGWMRLSAHVWVSTAEIDRVVEMIARV
jgi:isopenicillin-N epimerase